MREFRTDGEGNERRNSVLEIVCVVLGESVIHLHRAHRVSNVDQLLVVGGVENFVDEGWQVLRAHLVESEVPVVGLLIELATFPSFVVLVPQTVA